MKPVNRTVLHFNLSSDDCDKITSKNKQVLMATPRDTKTISAFATGCAQLPRIPLCFIQTIHLEAFTLTLQVSGIFFLHFPLPVTLLGDIDKPFGWC